MSQQNENNLNNSNIPENSSTKPMDSKRDVEKSVDAKTDQDFPGYPHYPAKEDIMDQRTDSHRVDVDVENLPNSNNKTGMAQRFNKGQTEDTGTPSSTHTASENDEDLDLREGTEADVNEDDLAILNATNGEIGVPQNVSNEELNADLDIPGSDLDDENEAIGEEDEENNYYSLGGDRHDNLEENPESDPQRGL